MFQSYVEASVFMLQIISVYLNVAYVAMAIHVYCKCMFQMFHPFLEVSCKCFIRMLHMFQWLYTYVASVCFQIFHLFETYVTASASCCKCFH
jgi:hypothetical protein